MYLVLVKMAGESKFLATDRHGQTRTFFIFLVGVLMCLISFGCALGIEELVRSYSFDYDGGEVGEVVVVDSLIGDSLFFEVDIGSTISGDYVFYVDLEDVAGVVSGTEAGSLGSSGGSVWVEVGAHLLSGKSQFNYSLRIEDSEGGLVYRKGGFLSDVYSYDSGCEVLGLEDFSDSDYVWLNVSVECSFRGRENVSTFLLYEGGSIFVQVEEELMSGVNYVLLRVDGEMLRDGRYVGAYEIERVLIGEKVVLAEYVTSVYDYRDFVFGSYLNGCFLEGVDLDSNGLVDYLSFDFDVVGDGEGYRVEADVYDLEGQYLWSLDDGVSDRVEGVLVHSLGARGPYFVRGISLFEGESLVDLDSDGCVVGENSFFDFERSELGDLILSLSGEDEVVSVEVSNIGGADAFGFWVDIFSPRDDSGEPGNASFSDKVFVDRLASGDDLVFEFGVGNFSGRIFNGVVDMENFVSEENESNNFGTWFEEACVELVINGSWGEWVNVTKCLSDNVVLQNRSRVEYDSNFCGVFENVTYWESDEAFCLYEGSLKACRKECRKESRAERNVCRGDYFEKSGVCQVDLGECLGSWSGSWFSKVGCFRESWDCRRGAWSGYRDCVGEAREGEKVCRDECAG